jgi:hypothetical protein
MLNTFFPKLGVVRNAADMIECCAAQKLRLGGKMLQLLNLRRILFMKLTAPFLVQIAGFGEESKLSHVKGSNK